MLMQQINQGIKIFCGTAFPYQNFHSVRKFFCCFFRSKTFMICGPTTLKRRDSVYVRTVRYRIYIFFCITTSQTWCMSIYRLVYFFCSSYFLHYSFIIIKHSRKIHHLTQVKNFRHCKQCLDICYI